MSEKESNPDWLYNPSNPFNEPDPEFTPSDLWVQKKKARSLFDFLDSDAFKRLIEKEFKK